MLLFNPRRSFFKLPIVWITFIIVIMASGVITTIIIIHGNYAFCGSSNCFNNFVSYFKVPIAILTILIPIFAVYAAQHRSEISIEQIKQAESQNNFANFYKHQEEFKKYLDDNKLDKLGDYRKIHISFFSNARNGDVTFSKKSQFTLHSILTHVFLKLKDIEKIEINNDRDILLVQEHLFSFTKKIQRFAKAFKLPIERYAIKKFEDTSQVELDYYLQVIKRFIADVEAVINFCPDYTPHLLIENLKVIKIDNNQPSRLSLLKGTYKFNLDRVSDNGQSHVIIAEQITESKIIPITNLDQQTIISDQETKI